MAVVEEVEPVVEAVLGHGVDLDLADLVEAAGPAGHAGLALEEVVDGHVGELRHLVRVLGPDVGDAGAP